MDSVMIEKDDQTSSTVCIVEALSDDLKNVLRSQLSSICQGATRGNSGKSIYSYKNTLKEFLVRYESKAEDTKKGIIGELLAHVLFIEFFQEFKIISPLFNMEERSIKKAFDIILFHSSENALYYTEVKSGAATNESSDDKNISLLGIAKSDIHQKLNDNNDNNWLNAINGATISLEKKKIKDEIVSILESCLEDTQNQVLTSSDKNVIFASVTYNSLIDKITLNRVSDYSKKNKKDFENCIFFSIQNDTFISVEEFLKNEASDAS